MRNPLEKNLQKYVNFDTSDWLDIFKEKATSHSVEEKLSFMALTGHAFTGRSGGSASTFKEISFFERNLKEF